MLLKILLGQYKIKLYNKKYGTVLNESQVQIIMLSREHTKINPIIPLAGSKGILQYKNDFKNNNGGILVK